MYTRRVSKEDFVHALGCAGKNDLSGFVSAARTMHNDFVCSDYVQRNDQGLITLAVQAMEVPFISGNEFIDCLARGFFHLSFRRQEQAEAYRYLSKAIELNPMQDLPYALRASLDPDINPNRLEDARTAALLHPSAVNYYVLAGAYDIFEAASAYYNWEETLAFHKLIREAILFYKKAVELDSNFLSARRKLGLLYMRLEEYDAAINEFRYILSLHGNHWVSNALWHCLYRKKRYEEALELAFSQLGTVLKPYIYQYRIGQACLKLKRYREAITFFKQYSASRPVDEFHRRNTPEVGNKLYDAEGGLNSQLIESAIKHFQEKDFVTSTQLFEEYLSLNEGWFKYNIHRDTEMYLTGLVNISAGSEVVNSSNPIFKRLDEFEREFLLAAKSGRLTGEEESYKIKLCSYRQTIDFGKYNSWKVEDVIRANPDYIIESVINLERFSICNESFLFKELKSHPQYLVAVEYNLIKGMISARWGSNNRLTEPENRGFSDGPSTYGYSSWDEMAFNVAFEGDADAWAHYNQ